MNKTDLTIIPENHPILPDSDTLHNILEEVKDLGGNSFPCARAKLAGVGSTRFSVVEVGDDASNAADPKEITGVIVAAVPKLIYWKNPIGSGEATPPDCHSEDGVTGCDANGNIFACATCPRNQFGSSVNGGNGKACQNKMLLYILREGDPFPLALTIPATSLKSFKNYRLKLIRLGLNLMGVLSKITLTLENRGGNQVPIATFAEPQVLNEAEMAKVKEYAKVMRDMAVRENAYQEEQAPTATPVDEDVPF